MRFCIALLALCSYAAADDFRWTITDMPTAPAFSWSITERGGDPESASETVAPSPGSVAAPPKDAAADLSICPCLGYRGKEHCYCLQRGVACGCNRTKGSEWNMESGRPVNKTGRYADPRRETFARSDAPAASAPADNTVPRQKSDGKWWWQGPTGTWFGTATLTEGQTYVSGTNRFVYRGGKMIPEMAVQIQQPAGGRWVKRCYGSYCRMEWVPN